MKWKNGEERFRQLGQSGTKNKMTHHNIYVKRGKMKFWRVNQLNDICQQIAGEKQRVREKSPTQYLKCVSITSFSK